MSASALKVERINQMDHLKKHLIGKLFTDIQNKPNDGRWRKYFLEFKFQGDRLEFSCEYRLDNIYLEYRKFHVQHKQIIIDVDEMQRHGWLDDLQ